MTLHALLLEQLSAAKRIASDGHELIPAWRIGTSGSDWLILSRFDQARPARQEWILHHIRRFMAWHFAHSFVLTGQTGFSSTALVRGTEEAIIGVAASRTERLLLHQSIHRNPSLSFGSLAPVDAAVFHSAYWDLLPIRPSTVSPEEVTELNAVFGFDGELSARWL